MSRKRRSDKELVRVTVCLDWRVAGLLKDTVKMRRANGEKLSRSLYVEASLKEYMGVQDDKQA
jgi:hypothetical protein